LVTTFVDGLSIAGVNLRAIATFLIGTLGFGVLCMDAIFGRRMGVGTRLLAGFCVGAAVLALPAYLLAIMENVTSGALAFGGRVLLAVAGLRLAFVIRRLSVKPPGGMSLLAGVFAALAALAVLRLAFLKHILLPPYTDSVIHYQIVQGFLHPHLASQVRLSLLTLPDQYYHFGFHGLAAWTSAVSGLSPEMTIPLLGQLLLVVAPTSVALLTFTATGSAAAAVSAGVLAALGWQMPAFAANWGKYPAMGALATLPAILACIHLAWYRVSSNTTAAGALVLLAAVTLLHTRSVILVVIAGASYLLARRLAPPEELSTARSLRFSILFLISLAPLYALLANFYSALLPGVLLVCLLPFAFRSHPRVAIGAYLFSFGLWAVTLVPSLSAGRLPTFLNRQFVEMTLYIPLAILGGAGLSGFVKCFPSVTARRRLTVLAALPSTLFVLLAVPWLYPDQCCNYFGDGDRRALEWIRASTSPESLFLIAAFTEQGQFSGTDGGIWLSALAGRNTNRIPFNTDWPTTRELQRLCEAGAREIYIYSGGRRHSFDEDLLRAQPWAQPVFAADATTVYRVADCVESSLLPFRRPEP
jgi:hypothetical protein